MRATSGTPATGAEELELKDVTAWLVLNSMRAETLQENQLNEQNLAQIWRENAFKMLVNNSGTFSLSKTARQQHIQMLLSESFVCQTGDTSKLRDVTVAVLFSPAGSRQDKCNNCCEHQRSTNIAQTLNALRVPVRCNSTHNVTCRAADITCYMFP